MCEDIAQPNLSAKEIGYQAAMRLVRSPGGVNIQPLLKIGNT